MEYHQDISERKIYNGPFAVCAWSKGVNLKTASNKSKDFGGKEKMKPKNQAPLWYGGLGINKMANVTTANVVLLLKSLTVNQFSKPKMGFVATNCSDGTSYGE